METHAVCKRTVRELGLLGIRLLRGESMIYDKIERVGPIQIIGLDYFPFDDSRYSFFAKVLQQRTCPAECESRRIVLLHDPKSFKHLKGDENAVVFSGHTHGGHCGIITCGVQWTFLNSFTGLADNGLWRKGTNRNYIHRGQGSRALYGNYVLRCGVPTEQSLVKIE